MTGSYWFECDANSAYNKFEVEVIDLAKINDLNNITRGYNEYEANQLLISGVPAGTKVRIINNQYIFADKFDYYRYTNYIDLNNTTEGDLTADYYFNGMVFRVGSESDATIVLKMSDAFRQCGVTDFYLFMRNLTAGSSFKIRNKADSADVIKATNFSGAITNAIYHVQHTPGISTFGTDWSITSSWKLP